MTEFLYLFRGGVNSDQQQSPEQMQAHMQKWGAWMGKLGEAGHFVSGFPLDAGGTVVAESGKVVTDGPFAEGAEIVGGYIIVKANDLNQATELAYECPVFENGGTVEVRALQSM